MSKGPIYRVATTEAFYGNVKRGHLQSSYYRGFLGECQKGPFTDLQRRMSATTTTEAFYENVKRGECQKGPFTE